jgi:diamine N-acetyltransferase
MDVALREVTRENLHEVLALEVAPEQRSYVATNAKSIAEAHFEPRAWFRAVYAGDEAVGFVMAAPDYPAEGSFYIWRFMIDARFQGRGYGARALQLLLDEARSRGAAEVTLSVQPGEHSAHGFYEAVGFERTGEVTYGQDVMRLRLADPA